MAYKKLQAREDSAAQIQEKVRGRQADQALKGIRTKEEKAMDTQITRRVLRDVYSAFVESTASA